jgi:hypothetical protein
VKDIDILREQAHDASRQPVAGTHVKVVMSFVQREGCDGGEPFNVTRARAPELVWVARRAGATIGLVRVPLESMARHGRPGAAGDRRQRVAVHIVRVSRATWRRGRASSGTAST